MEFEPLDIRQGVNVDVSFSRTVLPSKPSWKVLIIAARGKTGRGSGSNADAGYIEAMAQGFASVMRPAGLVFDFRQLEYEWGDGFCSTFAVGQNHWMEGHLPIAVAVSDLCRDGFTSLVKHELLLNPSDILFESLQSAVSAVDKKFRELRAPSSGHG